MKKEDIHFGQVLFCKELKYTKMHLGLDDAMRAFRNSYIIVESFNHSFPDAVNVKHSNGETYLIHVSDLIDLDNIVEEGDVEIIKIHDKKKVQFDENRLTI